jgi:hypothetical protein
MKFGHELKKWCFDTNFYVFSSKVQSHEKSRQAVVRSAVFGPRTRVKWGGDADSQSVLIPAVIHGWAGLISLVTPAPGKHGGRGGGDWVRLNPGLEISSHRARIGPRIGHQQSSLLTTELCRTTIFFFMCFCFLGIGHPSI